MRTRRLLPRGSRVLPLFVLAGLTACAGSSDSPVAAEGGAASLSVSFTAPAVAGAAATNAAGNLVLTGSGADTLIVTKLEMVLSHVKLRRAGVAACPDSIAPSQQRGRSHDVNGCSRLDLGPMLLDMPLGGAATSPLAVTVPAGTYHEFEFEVGDVSSSSRATQAEKDFLVAHPGFRDVTVRVTGTYKGAPFTFLSRAQTEVEFEFEPSLTVETGVNDNVSTAIDVSAWFRGAGGAIVAPTVANQVLIDQNIRNSFSAFGDRDRDGREDRGRGRHGGSGHGRDG
ncbi:MAG: hypothetical protein IT355_15560 [Gemmatimonadaceae bacterium]|nr:hypothetical protein [Gemmatimonadaceae bacterium]